MDHVINWISLASSLSEFQPTIDRIVNGIVSQTSCLATKINLIVEKFTSVENYALLIDCLFFFFRGSSFLHSLQHTKDLVINRGSSFLHNLQHTMNPAVNELVSLIRSLVTKINGDLLLRVAGAVGVAVAAIVVVRLLWTMISAVGWLLWTVISPVVRFLWKVISPVVSLPWKVISGGVRLLWKVIKAIFGGGKGGKTMKAPGRNYRMFRKDFELNPANYFRNLRK
ncbi:hypothetical protein JHK87_026427 [Glycine soja]|nr:hypothetical protein JHK87_026427 [Glycine soja]